jgi:hypothetical protein
VTREDNSFMGWIVGGIVAVAVILGIFLMMGRSNTNTAVNDRPAPNATVPAPVSGNGTSGTTGAPAPNSGRATSGSPTTGSGR